MVMPLGRFEKIPNIIIGPINAVPEKLKRANRTNSSEQQ